MTSETEKVDFKLNRLSDYSDGALIAELQRVSELVGRVPLTRALFDKHSRASASTVMRRFGGWERALKAAGLGELYGGQQITPRMREQPGKGITKEQVLEELRRVAGKLGRPDFTVDDFNLHGSFSVRAVRAFYRNWRRALEDAGLRPRSNSMRYTDEECYENLLMMWTRLGRQPNFREMKDYPSKVGGKAYVTRWSTWLGALEAFVARVQQDEVSVQEARTTASAGSAVPVKTKRPDDGRVRLGLRYRVLVRDHFMCVLCGNSPTRDPQCVLHIDHIAPHSRGGPTTVENLRTLCKKCNLGKGALMIEVD